MIFILGAKGFVGSAIFDYLDQFYDCTAIDFDNYKDFIGHKSDVFINANGNSKKFLAEENPTKDFELSVKSVVQSIFDFPTKKYIYISSVDVYTNFSDGSKNVENFEINNSEQSTYGFHKWIAEQYVIKNTDNWLILRLGGMIGPNLKKGPIYDIMNNIDLRVSPKSKYQYIETSEVGKIINLILTKNCSNETFNICGNGTISLNEVADVLGKKLKQSKFLKPQHYEINNNKINKKLIKIPETKKAVKNFFEKIYGIK